MAGKIAEHQLQWRPRVEEHAYLRVKRPAKRAMIFLRLQEHNSEHFFCDALCARLLGQDGAAGFPAQLPYTCSERHQDLLDSTFGFMGHGWPRRRRGPVDRQH